MQIPQATVRSLALRPINLHEGGNDEDEALDDDFLKDAEEEPEGNHNAAQGGGGADSGKTATFGDGKAAGGRGKSPSSRQFREFLNDDEDGGPAARQGGWKGALARFTAMFTGKRRSSRVEDAGSKKVLARSNMAAVILVRLQVFILTSFKNFWPAYMFTCV